MSFRVGTPNYGLPQTEGTDKRDWADTNQAFLLIDTAIKNAVDTSASAGSAAAAAQQTADGATTTAANAQTAAGNAQTLASSASELATLAKSTADTANSTATAAQTAAGNAQSAASAAQQTANNALPKSDVAFLQDTGTVVGTRYDGMSIKGYTIVTISFNNASATAGAVLMTLPAKLRPSTTSTIAAVLTSGGSTSAVFVTVSTNGNVTCPGALAGAFGSVTFIY